MTSTRASQANAFRAIAVAIVKGFLRDRTALFFAIVFPLMFLVLFGGLFADQGQSKVDLIEVGSVPLVDDLPQQADAAFRETFHVEHTDDLDAAIRTVRKGDADVAIQMDGDARVAHYTQTDQVKAAITQGALAGFVEASNVATLAQDTGRAPPYSLRAERVEDQSLRAIQFYTPGLLGWAVAMSAAFGAAATIQGWRQSKLIRRLQLAPVSVLFGPTLTGSWWMSIPLLVVGTLCFMAIGLLAGAVTKTTEGAVNAANFIVLPMSFLSGSFFPLDGSPRWLQVVSDLLPLKHLKTACST